MARLNIANKQKLKVNITALSSRIHKKFSELGFSDLRIHKIEFGLRDDAAPANNLVDSISPVNEQPNDPYWIRSILDEMGLSDLIVHGITFGLRGSSNCKEGEESQYVCKGMICEWKCGPK